MASKRWQMLAVILVIFIRSFSQTTPALPKILPPTPEAAALTKNGELSVGLYSGAAQAGIPLYTINLRGFSLPISLNYASNGFKVDELPSRVGMGWSLSAGGVVTRVVNGKPDDQATWYKPTVDINTLNFETLTYFYNLGIYETNEAEPDEFRITAPGLSGKFVLDSNKQPVLIPHNNYKIQIDTIGAYDEIIITNQEGIKYFFGGTNAVEVTTNHNLSGKLSGYNQISTGFFLRKVELPNMDSINFYYSSLNTRQITGITHTMTKVVGAYLEGCPTEECSTAGTNFSETYSDIRYSSCLLDSIQSSTGVALYFLYENRPDSSGDKRISEIHISEGVSTRKYACSYDNTAPEGNFSYNIMGDFNKRFFLKEIKNWVEKAGKLSEVLTHSFDYYNLSALPNRLSYAQDHFGFFNAKDNSNLLPSGTYSYDFSAYAAADRSSDGNAAATGLLKKITYPTSGYEEFVFEPHYYSTLVLVPYTATETEGGQGSGGTGIETYTSGCMNTLRAKNAILSITATEMPLNCTVCTVPDPEDNIVEVKIKNITDGTHITRTLTSFTSTTETISFLANKCYQIEVKVRGDYVDGFVSVQYDSAATDTYMSQLHHAPGARVKFIKSVDPVTGNINHKFNRYTSLNNLSGTSGSSLYSLNYITYSYAKNPCVAPGAIFNSYRICMTAAVTSNSNSYQYLYDNNHYVYSTVLESNDSTFVNGVTEHVYEVSPFSWATTITGDDVLGTPANTVTWFNGYETSTRNYDSSLTLVKQVDNFYHADDTVNILVRGIAINLKYDFDVSPESPIDDEDIHPYNVTEYYYQSNWVQHDSTVTREFDTQGNLLKTKTTMFYGSPSNTLPNKIEKYNSNGKLERLQKKYATDYTGQSPYQRMIDNNMISTVIETKTYVDSQLVYATKNNYNDFSASLSTGSPINILPQTTQTQKGSTALETRIRFSKYDQKGNPIELSRENDSKMTYIWDYAKIYPVAEAKNADSISVAYTSFESDENGNWTVSSPSRETTFSITGTKSYNLTTDSIAKTGLTNGKKYLVSYWSHTGIKTISGGSSISRTGKTVKGWTLYEHMVTMSGTTLRVSGAGLIDELRLFPVGSQMTTYTFEPFIGVTSVTSPNNMIVYYEYDAFNRLKNIKDFEGNIIKNYQYNYSNNCGNNCFVLQMRTFTDYNTPGYPVGVFNVNRVYLGKANSKSEYVSLWNADSANQVRGTLSATSDSLRFNIAVDSGAVIPSAVFGLRYYQWNVFGPTTVNAATDSLSFVDWGDSSRQLITATRGYYYETNPFSYITAFLKGRLISRAVGISHTYANTNPRTITVFHNETTEHVDIQGAGINNTTQNAYIRGYYPEKMKALNYSGIGNSSDTAIKNFTNLTDLVYANYQFSGDDTSKHNRWTPLNHCHKLEWLKLNYKNGNEIVGSIRSNFPLLGYLELHDFTPALNTLWAAGGFPNMYVGVLGLENGTTISTSEADTIIIKQAAAGSVTGGVLGFGGTVTRTSASTTAYNALVARSWSVGILGP